MYNHAVWAAIILVNMKIAIACDHAGYEYKERLVKYLQEKGHEVKDYGTHSAESMDYPDTAHPLAFAVEAGEHEKGIVLCGSGNGISMTVNKHQGIRCALCWNTELAALARQHNNANVVSIPARFIAYEEAQAIIDTFLATDFEGGRHQRRIDKIPVRG
jgi:ribose-5-phosphate isomerase B